MAPPKLTPSERRAIEWRNALGPGGITAVAGRVGYSPQLVSHVLLGRKANPTLMAYLAGAVGAGPGLLDQLVSPLLPTVVLEQWRAGAVAAYAAGVHGERFDVPAAHAAYTRHVREVVRALWSGGQPSTAARRPKRRRPESARRTQTGAAVPSSGDTTGNGPRLVDEKSTAHPRRAVEERTAGVREAIG